MNHFLKQSSHSAQYPSSCRSSRPIRRTSTIQSQSTMCHARLKFRLAWFRKVISWNVYRQRRARHRQNKIVHHTMCRGIWSAASKSLAHMAKQRASKYQCAEDVLSKRHTSPTTKNASPSPTRCGEVVTHNQSIHFKLATNVQTLTRTTERSTWQIRWTPLIGLFDLHAPPKTIGMIFVIWLLSAKHQKWAARKQTGALYIAFLAKNALRIKNEFKSLFQN